MNESLWNIGDLRRSQDTREDVKEMNVREKDLEETEKKTIREKVLEEAKAAVCRDRNKQYGEPERNFELIANLWCEYFRSAEVDIDFLEPWDVANMMILLKVARIAKAPGNRPSFDNFVDIAGYAACAAECVFGTFGNEAK